MSSVTRHDSTFFSAERLASIKKNNRICVVFSTLGERESSLLKQKLMLLKPIYGSLLDEIYISHRREGGKYNNGTDLTVKSALEAVPEVNIIDCAATSVPDMGDEAGKGADMRRALYTIANITAEKYAGSDPVIVFLDSDADMNYFTADYPVSLACAVIDGSHFAKAGFWRAMGRAKKFTAQPLFSAVDHPLLKNLNLFTYPLSGECAARLSFFTAIPFVQKYGIETSMLIDACAGDYRIADVNLRLYDHEHQDDVNVQKIAFGVIRTFLSKCEKLGLLEFKNGARVSDILNASFINESGKLTEIHSDSYEHEYQPLKNILQ